MLVLGLLVLFGMWLLFRSLAGSPIAIAAVVALAFFPFPTGLDVSIYGLAPYELALIPALISVLVRGVPRPSLVISGTILLVLLLWTLVGLFRDHPIDAIALDTRRAFILAAAIAIGSCWRQEDVRLLAKRYLPAYLWSCASVALAGSVGLLELGGRIRAASLEFGDTTAAVRLQIPPLYLAAAVLCALAAMGVADRTPRGAIIKMAAPASLIVLLGFTRNTVLALAVAVLVALIAARSANAFANALKAIASAGAVIGIIVAIALLLPPSDVSDYATRQISSFNDRVLQGLTPGAIAGDQSAQFRLQGEDPYLERAIADRPISGHGFGYAYRPAGVTGRVVTPETAGLVYYAHNYYLWIWTKCGLLGGSALLLSILYPVLKSLRQGATDALAFVAPLAGLMASSVVAPMPNGSPTSLLVGLLCGASIAILHPSHRSDARRVPKDPAEVESTGEVVARQRL